jgi:hypothetical protein
LCGSLKAPTAGSGGHEGNPKFLVEVDVATELVFTVEVCI